MAEGTPVGSSQGVMRRMRRRNASAAQTDRVLAALIVVAGATFIAAVLWLLVGLR